MPSARRSAAGAALAAKGVAARGLDRVEAAAYVGVGATLFDAMVRDGRMPPAKVIGGRRVWDRMRLDKAFDALPDDGDGHESAAASGGGMTVNFTLPRAK